MINHRRLIFTNLSSLLLTASGFCYALPFNVFPKVGTILPTQISSGQTVTALYTVQNNTASFRGNNFVKYLPPNVKQVFADPIYPGLCGTLFNLAPSGIAGDSCTLELQVTGLVNSNDPDPRHHLFVCFSGGRTCAGTLFPLNVTMEKSSQQVAVGNSFNSSTMLPLAYTNLGRTTWTLSPVFSLPNGRLDGALNGVSCIGSACSTVGFSEIGSQQLPLAYTTNNGGITWSLPSSFSLPSGKTDGTLNGVSCTGNTCIAVGNSGDGTNLLPLAFTSNDKGVTWALGPVFPLPSGKTDGVLQGVTCTGNACIAVGFSGATPPVSFPLIYTSNNGGITWTLSAALSLPSGRVAGKLFGVTCEDNTCIAVGMSFASASALPLGYISTNGGTTWTLSPAFVLPDDGQINGRLNSVTCIDSNCTVVGISDNSSFTNSLPLAYTSNNAGAVWTLSPAFNINNLPSGHTNGELFGLTCVGSACTSVGISFAGTVNELPLAYTSSNSGITWMLSSGFTLPNGQTNGELLSVASTV